MKTFTRKRIREEDVHDAINGNDEKEPDDNEEMENESTESSQLKDKLIKIKVEPQINTVEQRAQKERPNRMPETTKQLNSSLQNDNHINGVHLRLISDSQIIKKEPVTRDIVNENEPWSSSPPQTDRDHFESETQCNNKRMRIDNDENEIVKRSLYVTNLAADVSEVDVKALSSDIISVWLKTPTSFMQKRFR